MTELRKLIIESKKAITRLAIYLEYNEIELPIEIGFAEMREWFLVLQGYAECLEKHDLVPQEQE